MPQKNNNVLQLNTIIHSKALQIGVFFVVVMLSAGLIYYYSRDASDHSFSHFSAPLYSRALDGVSIRDRSKTHLRPIAVIIDNHEDARPSEGLDAASVVFETIAEGQITRLLAIYDPEELPDAIGAVRSLRPYYIDWAQEFNAVLFHVGGSPAALEQVSTYDHVDEFREGSVTFWRESSRFAPHNTFTNSERLLQSIERNEFATTSNIEVFTFGEYTSASALPAQKAYISFSESPYNTEWRFENDSYVRYIDGERMDVVADNLIVLEMNASIIDAIGRRDVQTEGSGRMWYMQNGTLVLGTWENTDDSPLQIFDITLHPLDLQPGKTWISVIDDESEFTFEAE